MRVRAERQSGVALIVALLIVALVSTVSIGMSWRFDLTMARNTYRWRGIQAEHYLQGIERFARVYLADDAKNGSVDHLDELWAQSQQFPADDGSLLSVTVIDAQSRLNLNNLGEPLQSKKVGAAAYDENQRRFIRLLQTFELEQGPMGQNDAESILQAVKDWIDADSNVTGFGGAESSYYNSLDPAFTIPNSEMISVTELRLIQGVTPQIYRELLPHVVALPKGQAMNINTMSAQLMRTINVKNALTPIQLEDAENLLKLKPVTADNEAFFPDLASFTNNSDMHILLGINNVAADFDPAGLAVNTNYFVLFGEALVGDVAFKRKSLMHRQASGEISVVRRSDSEF